MFRNLLANLTGPTAAFAGFDAQLTYLERWLVCAVFNWRGFKKTQISALVTASWKVWPVCANAVLRPSTSNFLLHPSDKSRLRRPDHQLAILPAWFGFGFLVSTIRLPASTQPPTPRPPSSLECTTRKIQRKAARHCRFNYPRSTS